MRHTPLLLSFNTHARLPRWECVRIAKTRHIWIFLMVFKNKAIVTNVCTLFANIKVWEFTSPVTMLGCLSNNIVLFNTLSCPLLLMCATFCVHSPALTLTELIVKKVLLEALGRWTLLSFLSHSVTSPVNSWAILVATHCTRSSNFKVWLHRVTTTAHLFGDVCFQVALSLCEQMTHQKTRQLFLMDSHFLYKIKNSVQAGLAESHIGKFMPCQLTKSRAIIGMPVWLHFVFWVARVDVVVPFSNCCLAFIGSSPLLE